MTDPETITHETALDTFQVAYIRRVGVGHDRIGYSDLQDQTGIPVRTLKSWREGQAMPHLENLLKLGVVFGPEFMSEILGVIGQGGVEYVALDDQSDVHECLHEITVPLHEIIQRLRDGKFCHRDKAQVGPMLVRLGHYAEEQGKTMISESKRGPGR